MGGGAVEEGADAAVVVGVGTGAVGSSMVCSIVVEDVTVMFALFPPRLSAESVPEVYDTIIIRHHQHEGISYNVATECKVTTSGIQRRRLC